MDKLLSLLGLAKRAGRLAVGEAPVGAAARAHTARLILLASDAAGNSARRAARFADEGRCPLAALPADKAALGGALGRASAAMLALTDLGFAAAAAKQLAARDAAQYGATAAALAAKAARRRG